MPFLEQALGDECGPQANWHPNQRSIYIIREEPSAEAAQNLESGRNPEPARKPAAAEDIPGTAAPSTKPMDGKEMRSSDGSVCNGKDEASQDGKAGEAEAKEAAATEPDSELMEGELVCENGGAYIGQLKVRQLAGSCLCSTFFSSLFPALQGTYGSL